MRLLIIIVAFSFSLSPLPAQSEEGLKGNRSSMELDQLKAENTRIRELSMATLLAQKSLNSSRFHPQAKALLAEQALSYYTDNNGNQQSNLVYNSLYYALKEFNDPITYTYSDVYSARGNIFILHGSGPTTFLSIHENGTLYEWSTLTREFEQRSGYWKNLTVKTVEISPDGNNLFMAGRINGKAFAEIIDLRDSSRKASISDLASSVTDATYIDNDRIFILDANGHSIKSYSNRQVVEVVKPTEKLTKIKANSKGNRIYAAGTSGNLYRYDVENGFGETVLSNSKDRLTSIEINADDSYLAFGESNGLIHLLSPEKDIELNGHSSGITDIAFSSDGKYMASASLDKSIRLWNLNDIHSLPVVMDDNNALVSSLMFTTDNKFIVAATSNRAVKLYPVQLDQFSGLLCGYLSANFSIDEWEQYLGREFEYRGTCPNLASTNLMK